MTATCAASCTIRGRHKDDCEPDTGCKGCLPGSASQGSQVCQRCERRTYDGLRDLPELYEELLVPLTGRRTPMGPAGETALPLSDAARHARHAIKACLVAWCLLLHEEFDLTLPADAVPAMVNTLTIQARRLLSHPEHADQLVHDITEAAGYAWSLVRPRTRVALTVACDCGDRVDMTGIDPSDPNAMLTCPGCGDEGVVGWWRSKLAPKLDGPMGSAALLTWLLEVHHIRIAAETLRQWAARGHVVRVGKDGDGCITYDPVNVASYALANITRIRQVEQLRQRKAKDLTEAIGA